MKFSIFKKKKWKTSFFLKTGLKLDFEWKNWFKTGLKKKTGLVQKTGFSDKPVSNRFWTISKPIVLKIRFLVKWFKVLTLHTPRYK